MILLASHKVPNLKKPIRLQEYGVGIFYAQPTKSGFKKAIKKQLVFVDEKVATTALFIVGGETIQLFQLEENKKKFNLALTVLFEDDYMAVIYKPAGILVSGNSFATITNALTSNLTKSNQPDAVTPKPIHRLDYPTSGLLIIGKTATAINKLNKLFENKKIIKTYHAITIGKMEAEGNINSPIDEKQACTIFKVLRTVVSKQYKQLNLVQLEPKTGRTHQLRKHLLGINNPILGDKKYYLARLVLYGKGLYLHASSLSFLHPFTTKHISITKELPKKFRKIFPS